MSVPNQMYANSTAPAYQEERQPDDVEAGREDRYLEPSSQQPSINNEKGDTVDGDSVDASRDGGVVRIEALCELHSPAVSCLLTDTDTVFGKGWKLYMLWASIALIS